MNRLKPRRTRATSVRPHRQRPGIILLVVLGMLTLFSVLGVSYLIFTSQNRSAASNISRSEAGRIDTKKLVEDALGKILVGSNGPESSLWGHDVLGDLFGMRDGVQGSIAQPNNYVGSNIDSAPALLMGNTFLRFPTQLYNNAVFTDRRNDLQVERRYPGYPGAFNPTPGGTRFPVDDMLNGRLITFLDGPLEMLTFPIVRSFGDHRNVTPVGRETLSGQVVIDLRDHLNTSVEIDGESRTLQEWFNVSGFSPHRLIYDRVVTTGHISGSATPLPIAYSDFYINGRILNGPGLGWDLTRTSVGTTSGPDFNLNELVSTALNVSVLKNRPASFSPGPADIPFTGNRYETGGSDLPAAFQGHYGLHRLPADFNALNPLQSFVTGLPPGDVDEPYDAADYNNLWLSYFPNDPQLGEPTPSFVRPALLNWIFNQAGNLSSLTAPQLRRVLYALQRSTLRPLPFVNDPMVPASIANRSEGVLRLSYANFTGSNASNGLQTPTNISSTDTNYLRGRIIAIAKALAGEDFDGDGKIDTWDVDNRGTGQLDSVWIDAGMAPTQDPSGRLIKPMVAFVIEDMGGRANVNRIGNLAQARNLIGTTLAGGIQQNTPTRFPSANSPTGTANYSVNDLPTGFGYGPAEIDLRALFVPNFARPSFADQMRFGPQRILGDRLNTWSLTLGRVPSTVDLSSVNAFIAAGHLRDPLTARGNDWRGAIRDPLRSNLHNFTRSQGIPTDTFGRMTIGTDLGGGIAVGNAFRTVPFAGGTAGDTDDDPYEFQANANTDPDSPYRYGELESLLRFDGFDRDLASSRLIELIENYHNQTPTSRAQLDQITQLKRLLADSITTHSNSAAIATGGLPSEWRSSTAFANDLRSGGSTIAANAALPPQHLFYESLDTTSVPALQRDQVRNAWLWALLPPEIRAGGRLNLNRPFGNGMNEDDDNRDGTIATFPNTGTFPATDVRPYADVIDDPQEVAAGEVHLRYNSNTGPANTLWSSTRGDVTPGEPGRNSRVTFARHLYVLAMFLTRNAATKTSFDFPFDNTLPFTPLNGSNAVSFEDEYRAWKIAQWAVNVADFRDSDGIMTRFDYDPNPYNGWEVRNIGGDPNDPSYRTVWGLEFPEMTLEESFAFHDRKVRDTNRDPSTQRVITTAGMRGSDTTPDQYQIPEGSLFLEVRNARSPQPPRVQTGDANVTANPMGFPTDLYRNVGRVDNPRWMLDLGAEAPDRNPVWRVAITRFHSPTTRPESCPDFLLKPVGSDAPPATFGTGPALDRDTTTLDPARPQFFGNAVTTSIDRVVWFTRRNPDADDDGVVDFAVPLDSAAPGKIFYNRTTSRYLAPGQIAVIGPRPDTAIGTALYDDASNLVIDPDGTPRVDPDKFGPLQRVRLINENVQLPDRVGNNRAPIFDTSASALANASARPVLSFIAQSNPPTRWTNANTRDRTIGLNISEPYEISGAAVAANPSLTARDYYIEPTQRLSDRTNGGFRYEYDTWFNFDSNTGQLPDEPFDGQPGSELRNTLGIQGQRTGTREHYKTAYLQRLADPTQPYHARNNPYISVDYISLDLTVFNGSQDNGDDTNTDATGIIWPDPSDPDPFTRVPQERFASRYKTGVPINVDATMTTQFANLTHSVSTFPPARTTAAGPPAVLPPPAGTAVDICRIQMNVLPRTSDINQSAPGSVAIDRQTHSITLGWANRSYGRRWQQSGTQSNALTPFIGLPFESWMSNVSWLNRQFVSPEELMWVPTSAPGRLGFEFGSAAPESGLAAGSDPYDDSLNGTPAVARTDQRRYGFNQRFPHLFNFFSSNNNNFDSAGGDPSPNLWRLLEWVEVPPPFDVDADFVSPEGNLLTTGENSVLPPNFNYASFYNNSPAGSYIDANPLTWNFASTLGGSRGYSNGVWGTSGSQSNGFWTNHVSMDMFRPPFSFRSKTFRHGTINLNTIKNARVYKALMYGYSVTAERATTGRGAFWSEFHNSRRGYPYAPDATLSDGRLRPSLNNANPTQIGGVFKPGNSGDIRPQLSTTTPKPPLESTTMRPNATTSTLPLFQRGTPPAASQAAQSFERSVVHNQLGQTRLANLASGQSNVFAIWITVGLFEVDAATLTVGQEIGSDTGRVRRAKGFFIIDRSIPVMYRPGELNNAMDTVQLSRIVD